MVKNKYLLPLVLLLILFSIIQSPYMNGFSKGSENSIKHIDTIHLGNNYIILRGLKDSFIFYKKMNDTNLDTPLLIILPQIKKTIKLKMTHLSKDSPIILICDMTSINSITIPGIYTNKDLYTIKKSNSKYDLTRKSFKYGIEIIAQNISAKDTSKFHKIIMQIDILRNQPYRVDSIAKLKNITCTNQRH